MARRKSLPDGWKIVSLHSEGQRPIVGPRPSDAKIAQADAIRVSYTNRRTGVTTFRTIHGAKSRRQVGDIIDRTTRVVSPV
jgi:lipopolysaccharide/colanic/teichoic acid biosynthesis glycosyltransferase